MCNLCDAPNFMKRRSLIAGVMAASPLLPVVGLSTPAHAQPVAATVVPGRRLLLKGGYVASCDKALGGISGGDVLISGDSIEDLNVMPVTDPVSSAILICNPSNVSWVIINGDIKKRDGQLVGYDIARAKRLVEASHAHLTQGLDRSGHQIPT